MVPDLLVATSVLGIDVTYVLIVQASDEEGNDAARMRLVPEGLVQDEPDVDAEPCRPCTAFRSRSVPPSLTSPC